MSQDYNFYVYIMVSASGTIYVGVTRDLQKRVYEHKNDLIDGFTKKYKCHKLVYMEPYNDIRDAIKREKEIKGWKRYKKIDLIKTVNPHWNELYQN